MSDYGTQYFIPKLRKSCPILSQKSQKKSLILTYTNEKCEKSYLKNDALSVIGIVDHFIT